jgi:RNA polymerase sigma-70 factor (ECF subfamily)
MLKLHRAVEKSDGNRSFSSVYLEKSVCGAVVDEIRRACRRREDPVQQERQLDGIAGAGDNPERGAFASEIARSIVDCLARLGRPRKLAVTLYLYGCSVPEAAGRLGWNLRKTESLVYRGLADLRACLERRGVKP